MVIGRRGREGIEGGEGDGAVTVVLSSDGSRSGARGMKTAEDLWLASPNHAKYKFLNLLPLLLPMCKGQSSVVVVNNKAVVLNFCSSNDDVLSASIESKGSC